MLLYLELPLKWHLRSSCSVLHSSLWKNNINYGIKVIRLCDWSYSPLHFVRTVLFEETNLCGNMSNTKMIFKS